MLQPKVICFLTLVLALKMAASEQVLDEANLARVDWLASCIAGVF